MNGGQDFSIVAVDKFIQATRDSGYKGTSSAVAELVDNSLQAGATEIAISVTVDECGDAYPVVLSVIDNGSGMDAPTLRAALRFGGSTHKQALVSSSLRLLACVSVTNRDDGHAKEDR